MKLLKRFACGFIALSLALTSMPFNALRLNAYAAEPVVSVLLRPGEASTFNDTDGDGLGEFQGWGTSLCWWANRVGYSEALTKQAADLFYGENGLRWNIGRYNVGGGDYVGTVPPLPEVPANSKAVFYDLETEGYKPTYTGTNMKVETKTSLSSVTYNVSDADFGITKGYAVGNFKAIGWINELGTPDNPSSSGGNLHYTVNAAQAGAYTVKMLLTLSGSNTRNVAIRVNGDEARTYSVDSATLNSNIIASGNNNMLFLATMSDVMLDEGANTIDIGGIGDWTLDFVKMAVIKKGDEGVLPKVDVDEFLHEPHITRSDSVVPGYATDVVRISTSGKTADELRETHTRVDVESDFAWNYDWNADKNQMNVLKAAAAASGEGFLAEAFSNSPPYFLTVSGCSSGNADASKDNLRADAYNAFAAYMADVIEHWNKEGVITFTSTTPMNEPYTSYWGANSNKQEGCHFDIGTSESKIIEALNKELKAKGINIIISGTDETSIDTQISAFNALSAEAKEIVTRIDTHTYSGSKRAELAELAQEAGKNLWMSEVDGAVTAGSNAGEMSAALGFAQLIKTDLAGLKSSAWIMWNAIDMHIDAKNPYDPDSMAKLQSSGTYKPNGGYWGIAIGDHNEEKVILTRKYYAYGQFSRYIRPGYTIIGSTGNTLAAYDAKGKQVVIVAINTSGSDQTWKFDLSRFQTMGSQIQAIRTSGANEGGENWADVTAIDDIVANTEAKNFTAIAKANSITTYIVQGVEYDGSEEPVLKEIEIDPETMVTGSAPWNNSANDAKKAFDGNLNTFFDGVGNGYVQVDFGVPVRIDALAYAPRSGYADRMVDGSFFGSADGKEWTRLYTITGTPQAGTLTTVYAAEFATTETEYRYLKYAVPDSNHNCNVAEIKVYGRQTAFTEKQIAANNYVLYVANAGTSDPLTVPTGYLMGLYQSNVDQRYGEDAETGIQWGLLPDDANSIVERSNNNATDITASYINMSPSIKHVAGVSGLKYDFALPARENNNTRYEVTVGFACPWSARNVTIRIEGQDLETVNIGNYVGTYQVDVTDGVLNVMVHNPGRTSQYADPVLNYIIVKAVPEASLDALRAYIDSYLSLVEGNTYSDDTKAVFDAAIAAGEALIAEGSTDAFAIQKVMDDIKAAYENLRQVYTYTSITGTNGAVLYDNNGYPVQAHGGQVQKWGDTYYWYGEDKSFDYRPVVGVHLYTSKDLYNWTDGGVVLRSMPVSEKDYEADLPANGGNKELDLDYMLKYEDGYFAKLYEGYENLPADDSELYENKLIETYWNLAEDRSVIERPKVLYNAKNDNYVMWFHADGRTPASTADYGKARVGVAVSDSPFGPFQLQGTYLLASGVTDHSWDNEGGHARDMGVFQDDDGTAYVIYSSEGNTTMYVAKLNDDYTNLVKDREKMVLGEDFVISSTNSREAPAVLKYKGMYYMITSGTSGWNPNQAQYAVADSMLGTWTSKGDPCVGDNNTTFRSQSTFVIPVDTEAGKYIYMGDRWQNPDNGGALRDSRYMWLPIEFGSNNTIILRDYHDWTLEDLENKGSFEVATELPTIAPSVTDVPGLLPDAVSIDYGDEIKEEAVTWDMGGAPANKLGVLVVTGTITSTGRTFNHSINLVNPKLIYFFDSGSTDSAYFNVLKAELGWTLRNDLPDAKYPTGGQGGGYTGVLQSENSSNYDLGHRDGSDYLSDGWWAGSNKTIDYAFELEAGTYTVSTGYQEWWSTRRPTRLIVSFTPEGGTSRQLVTKNFTVETNSTDLQVDQQFTITETGVVTVRIQKTGNPDPVLSWIGIVRDQSNDPMADLNWLIKKAEALNEEDYTEGTWNALQEALAAAKAVAANENATAEEIEAAKEALIKAMEALKVKADKTALQALVDEIEAFDKTPYTAASLAAFEEALAEAKAAADALLADTEAEQADVDEAFITLKLAYEAAKELLVTIEQKLLDGIALYTIPEENKDLYTDASWDAYLEALNAAKALVDTGADEATVDAALDALKAAVEALVSYSVDKSKLEEAVNNAPTDSSLYTAASWAAYQEALEAAKAVLAAAKPEQSEIDTALNALLLAQAGLVTIEQKLLDGIDANTIPEEDEELYTAGSWDAYLEALKAAQDLIGSGADEETVDAALDALRRAVAALTPYNVDKTALINAIENALTDGSKYTDASWAKYLEALNAAIAVRDDRRAEQTDVDQALEALLKAERELVIRKTESSSIVPATGDNTPFALYWALFMIALLGLVVIGKKWYAKNK